MSAAVLIVTSYCEGEMYAEYLRSVGYAADHVRTPEAALARLRRRPPAVIVTDMVFTGGAHDGPAFMRLVRAHPACAQTTLIVVSGFARPADRSRARAASADLFLVKPCVPSELARHIDDALRANEHSARAEWNWPDDGLPA